MVTAPGVDIRPGHKKTGRGFVMHERMPDTRLAEIIHRRPYKIADQVGMLLNRLPVVKGILGKRFRTVHYAIRIAGVVSYNFV